MRIKYLAFIAIACAPFTLSAALAENDSKGAFVSMRISDSPLSGGEGTVFNTSREAFAKPVKNLPTSKLRDFTFGNKMFNTKWVTAPASVTTLDGLGPTFNRMSCAACHFKDGRGRPPLSAGEPMKSMLMRLSIPGQGKNGGPVPHPSYGKQLNDRAIHGVSAEGIAKIFYDDVSGEYADGTPYVLRRPNYEFMDLAFGPLGADILFSPRVAPAVHGMGLLEAIPEEAILSLADPDDEDGDGISGRPNFVWSAEHQEKALGRFGWKANVATLHEQDASAALGDMGITTSLFPHDNCPAAQEGCQRAPNGNGENGAPEMSDKQLDKMTFYVSTLAVPARRDMLDQQVMAGAILFEKAKCASCHTPQMRTGEHHIAALANQNIQPFTDLLLHDMGEGLADNRPDFEASGREWRTPPLWGIGLVQVVNKHTNFLHDGRARNLEEAILWHGGEAEASKEMFKSMNKNERESLIRFLNSL